MARLFSMNMNIPGVDVGINYNASNLRITTVEWALPQSGVTVNVKIWNNGTLFYDTTVIGPGNGTENVAGNNEVVWITEGFGAPGYALPPNITWKINIESPSS